MTADLVSENFKIQYIILFFCVIFKFSIFFIINLEITM